MFRGVTDLNLNFLRHWGFLPSVSHHVFRPMRVLTTHGSFTPSHVPPLCPALSYQDVFASRSVPLHGIRTTDLPRKPARHRNLSARSLSQALSSWHQRQRCAQHNGRCQRILRLPHLRGFRHESHPDRPQALRQRQLRGGTGSDSLRARYHHHRPLLERLSLAALSSRQGRRQDAYVAGLARQHPHFHSHQRRQDARGQCARHPRARSWQFLHHGSRLHRLRSLVHATSSAGVLYHPRQIQSAIPQGLFTPRGPVYRADLRPNHCLNQHQSQQGIPATPALYQVPRCRARQGLGLPDQPLRVACADHRPTLPLPLAGRTIFKVDQTASSDQAVLRHLRERGQNTNMDRHFDLRPSRHREETPQNHVFALHNITDTEPDTCRKNTTRSTT